MKNKTTNLIKILFSLSIAMAFVIGNNTNVEAGSFSFYSAPSNAPYFRASVPPNRVSNPSFNHIQRTPSRRAYEMKRRNTLRRMNGRGLKGRGR